MPTSLSTSSAVGSLYVDHGGWLQQWLSRRFGGSFNAADVADLTHDTFVRLLLKPCEFDGSGDARAFLCTVARGLCIDQWRRRQLERAWLEALASQPGFVEPSLEYRALVLEALEEIDAMLRRLPGKARQAFLLAQLYGMGYREIAAEVGVSERMVKKYMAQAMFQCLVLEASLSP
ncbi:sigma-70 family RNA polymerase sigma factor [Pseudomonas sp. dw_358]|uniref:sigma-70 family RNA polymerase sigma factor n=1 Tax=Pseudomonas sp. dw_358 TaxID=2720083 RepID=UPI001C4A0083|nr:sigma-70 family RNA polymerase sigma factor [Pseudomonas sp. dw_358]